MKLEKVTISTPADEKYVIDEQITYMVTVTNDGNVTLTNVKITDPLTGDEWTIASLAPNESKEFTTTAYTVTADDVVAGSVTNKATATATDPDGKTDGSRGCAGSVRPGAGRHEDDHLHVHGHAG